MARPKQYLFQALLRGNFSKKRIFTPPPKDRDAVEVFNTWRVAVFTSQKNQLNVQAIFQGQNAPNPFSAGALSRTQLGEFTTIQNPLV